MFDPFEIIIAGYSRFPQNTSAERLHAVLALVARVDIRTHTIVAVSSTLVTDVGRDYLGQALVGINVMTDAERFIRRVQYSYFGHAQRAVLFAFRDLVTSYSAALQTIESSDAVERAEYFSVESQAATGGGPRETP